MEEDSTEDSQVVDIGPQPPPPLNCTTVEFLQRIHSPGSVIHIFIKEVNFEKNHHLVGYYDWNHLEKLSTDVQQHNGNATGIFYGLNPVRDKCLERAKNCLVPASQSRSSKNSDIKHRKLMLIDIDTVRDPNYPIDDLRKNMAYFAGKRLEFDLQKKGWPKPLIVDSGNGYHLLYRVNLLTQDNGLISTCLKAIANNFDDRDFFNIDTVVYDAARLARLPGTKSCKGISTEGRLHRICNVINLPENFEPVLNPLLEEMADQFQSKIPQGPIAILKTISIDNPSKVISRARAYLAKMSPAIEGQNGRNQFLNAAFRLLDDFALNRVQTTPLLAEYNNRCVPPFDSKGFEDKINSALIKVNLRGGPSGCKVLINKKKVKNEPAKSECTFYGHIPDFGFTNKYETFLPVESKFARQIEFLYTFFLWKNLCLPVQIPDLFLRQLYWGGKYDRNWKKRLPKMINSERPPKYSQECLLNKCIFYGIKKKHSHFNYLARNNDLLNKHFNLNENLPIRDRVYGLFDPKFEKLRENLQKQGDLFYVYWPALIFGFSRKVGWSWAQQRLVVGMVLELTRMTRKLGEDIAGEVIRGAEVHGHKNLKKIKCPLLALNKDYVVFGGNVKGRVGQGYRVVGTSGKGWVFRAGYLDAPQAPPSKRMEYLKLFLATLDSLKDELGLIPAALGYGEWKTLDQMIDLTRTEFGRKWLEECNLRIFAPANWRLLWRQFFSAKLGFDWIPAHPNDVKPGTEETQPRDLEAITTANQLRKWMRSNKVTQSNLALEVSSFTGKKCSVRRIQRHLKGNSNTSTFFEAIEQIRLKRLATQSITHTEVIRHVQS